MKVALILACLQAAVVVVVARGSVRHQSFLPNRPLEDHGRIGPRGSLKHQSSLPSHPGNHQSDAHGRTGSRGSLKHQSSLPNHPGNHQSDTQGRIGPRGTFKHQSFIPNHQEHHGLDAQGRIGAKWSPESRPFPNRHKGSVRGYEFLRVRGGRKEGKGSVNICGICPESEAISPCVCQCLNETAAELVCGPDLLTCSQLTDVMCLSAYPVNPYHRLVVQNTALDCKLERDLWGPLMFKEIVITNNGFQALDNLAFQPFSGTLMALDLEGNSLKDVYFSTMNDTPLLRLLSLRNNLIEFLPGYVPMRLPVLEVFDASFNKITAILPQTFEGMPKLQMIDLSNNAITKVSAGAFTISQHAGRTLYINLANNLITNIEPGMLEGVRECGINLQDNHLSILSEKVFRPIIDFTAGSAVFLTANNPLYCDSRFCWIATNKTVSGTFGTVMCPNLGDKPVETLEPSCPPLTTTTPPTRRLGAQRLNHKGYSGYSRSQRGGKRRKAGAGPLRLPDTPTELS